MKWKQFLVLSLLGLSFISCKTVEQVTESYKVQIDTVYISKYHTDSIYLKDSIYIKEKGDTVWLKEWHTKYIDKSRVDTIYLTSNDTCYVTDTITLPPEKYVPKWLIWLLLITGGITLVVLIKWIIKLVVKIKTGGLNTILSKLL